MLKTSLASDEGSSHESFKVKFATIERRLCDRSDAGLGAEWPPIDFTTSSRSVTAKDQSPSAATSTAFIWCSSEFKGTPRRALPRSLASMSRVIPSLTRTAQRLCHLRANLTSPILALDPVFSSASDREGVPRRVEISVPFGKVVEGMDVVKSVYNGYGEGGVSTGKAPTKNRHGGGRKRLPEE